MNPQPELTFRTETLAAEQNRRAIELRRIIRERTDAPAPRSMRTRFAALRRRARVAPVASETPCAGAHAHA